MKFRFLLIATACLGMIACSKNDGVTTDPSESGSKSIVMKIATPVTRAYIIPDAPYQPSTDISSIDVYFTNSNSTIQSAYRLTGQDLDNITTSGLRFVNLNNVSAVFVVANSPKALLAAGDRMDNDFIANLSDQGPALDQGSMIFAGCDTDITPVALDTNVPDVPNYSGNTQEPQYDKDQVYTADITIRPLISRIPCSVEKLETLADRHIPEQCLPRREHLCQYAGSERQTLRNPDPRFGSYRKRRMDKTHFACRR